MRIAQIEYGFNYPPTGGEQIRVNEVCRLLSNKLDMRLFYPSVKEITYKPSFEIESFEYKTKEDKKGRVFWVNKQLVNNIWNKLKDFQPDIIHHHFGAMPSLVNAIVAGNNLSIPQITTFHQFWPLCYRGTYWDFENNICEKENVCGRCMLTVPIVNKLLDWKWKKTVEWIINSISHFITYSNFMRKKLIKAGIKEDNISVIPFGVDFENIPQEDAKREYVVFSGRLSREKGVDLLLKNIPKITGDRFEMIVIGDGPQRKEYENLGKSLGLNIKFTGWLNNRNGYYRYIKKAICVVVPSLWIENSPLVIGEAFACETPVIGTNSGGIPELINDSGAGFVIERDAKEIAEKIEVLLENPELREEMGKKGRTYAEEHFNWERNVSRIAEIYEGFVNSKLT